MWMNMTHSTIANTWKVQCTSQTTHFAKDVQKEMLNTWDEFNVSHSISSTNRFSVHQLAIPLSELLMSTVKLDHKSMKNIGNMLKYLHKTNPAPWISGQMKINKSETTCLDFSCCGNYFLQCTVLSSEKKITSLSLIGYPIQHNMVGIVFNCLAAAKVLLTLQPRDPATSQLLTTGCLCSEMPEGQRLDHVPKWSDCCIDRIFLGFNFAQTSFSAKSTPREGCG